MLRFRTNSYAVTGHTAAEIVVNRADPGEPNMALTNWQGSRVRKQDVTTAKNYLTAEEVDTLNRLVAIFLEQAELRVQNHNDLTLDYWRNNVDRLLEFNERPVLEGAGSISARQAEQIAHERYEQFDAQRRQDEAAEADEEDLRELEAWEQEIKRGKPQ
nr:RhuM family protein [Arhodomonas aquaeolei]